MKEKMSITVADAKIHEEIKGLLPLVRVPASSQQAINQAFKNLDKWGLQDIPTLCLAAQEECGELAQAWLKYIDEGGDKERVATEAIDLAAVCLQICCHFEESDLTNTEKPDERA